MTNRIKSARHAATLFAAVLMSSVAVGAAVGPAHPAVAQVA